MLTLFWINNIFEGLFSYKTGIIQFEHCTLFSPHLPKRFCCLEVVFNLGEAFWIIVFRNSLQRVNFSHNVAICPEIAKETVSTLQSSCLQGRVLCKKVRNIMVQYPPQHYHGVCLFSWDTIQLSHRAIYNSLPIWSLCYGGDVGPAGSCGNAQFAAVQVVKLVPKSQQSHAKVGRCIPSNAK